MMIAHPLLNSALEIREGIVNVLVIENAAAYRSAVASLHAQNDGEDGEFVLSENYVTIGFSKKAEFIPDIFALDFSGKKLMNQLVREAEKEAEPLLEKTTGLLASINELGFEIISNMDVEVSFLPLSDVSQVIKMLNIYVDVADLSLAEKLLEYMKLSRRYLGKELFVLPSLKSCLSFDELELFYRSAAYEKLDIMLIESHASEAHSNYEKVMIIDNDLCQI